MAYNKKVDVGYYFKNLRRDELETVLQNFQYISYFYL